MYRVMRMLGYGVALHASPWELCPCGTPKGVFQDATRHNARKKMRFLPYPQTFTFRYILGFILGINVEKTIRVNSLHFVCDKIFLVIS